MENDGGSSLILQQLAQNGSSGSGALLVIVGSAEFNEYLGTVADNVRQGYWIALRGCSGRPEAKDVGEDDLGILARFEW